MATEEETQALIDEYNNLDPYEQIKSYDMDTCLQFLGYVCMDMENLAKGSFAGVVMAKYIAKKDPEKDNAHLVEEVYKSATRLNHSLIIALKERMSELWSKEKSKNAQTFDVQSVGVSLAGTTSMVTPTA